MIGATRLLGLSGRSNVNVKTFLPSQLLDPRAGVDDLMVTVIFALTRRRNEVYAGRFEALPVSLQERQTPHVPGRTTEAVLDIGRVLLQRLDDQAELLAKCLNVY